MGDPELSVTLAARSRGQEEHVRLMLARPDLRRQASDRLGDIMHAPQVRLKGWGS